MSEFGFGTLVTNLSNYMGTGHSVRQQERDEQMSDYLQREKMGIQSRVEGAKAAGIHPLVAMGFQAGPGPSTVVGGVREASHMGMDNMGDEPAPAPAGTQEDPNAAIQTRILEATARTREAEAELAEIQAHNAMRALANQPGQPIGILNGEPNPGAVTSPLNLAPKSNKLAAVLKPGIKLKPDEVTMGKDGLTAGVHQSGTKLELPNGETWNIPSSLAAEGLEDLDLAKYYLLWQLNKDKIWNEFKGFSDKVRKATPKPGYFDPGSRRLRLW